MPKETHCPLCGVRHSGVGHSGDGQARAFHRDKRRTYLRCPRCTLVFVPTEFQLDRVSEKAEYDKHQNDVADEHYRGFLSRLATPLIERLPQGASGLDFGCGPGPALAAMLTERGMSVALYDPFYVPDEDVLSDNYDFICATEVVEHLRNPGRELARLWSRLNPGGWLGVMTKLVRSPEAFPDWHYIRDPTHICFFSRDTWCWWADEHDAALQIIGQDVILLQRTL